MGYSTRFTGRVGVTPRLNEHEIAYLRRFADTRHMDREQGPYYCAARGADDEHGVFDDNQPGPDQPGLWCCWEAADGGRSIRWNKAEKFYQPAEWMAYVIQTFLMPGARLAGELADPVTGRYYAPEFEHFTFDHACDGVLKALGDAPDDRWSLVVAGGDVFVQRKGEEHREGPITDTSAVSTLFVRVLLAGGPHDGETHDVWATHISRGLRLPDGTRYAVDPSARTPSVRRATDQERIMRFQASAATVSESSLPGIQNV